MPLRDDVVDGSDVSHGDVSQVGFQKAAIRFEARLRRSPIASSDAGDESGCLLISPLCGPLSAILAEHPRSSRTVFIQAASVQLDVQSCTLASRSS